jgi:hypothetical protein
MALSPVSFVNLPDEQQEAEPCSEIEPRVISFAIGVRGLSQPNQKKSICGDERSSANDEKNSQGKSWWCKECSD